MLKLIALNYTVMLNGYSQWLNIKEDFFYRDILISVMPKYTVFMLFVHCKFEDLTWNYHFIKVYLKTLMLGGINRD